jgi:flagellar biosynthesis protein FlhB
MLPHVDLIIWLVVIAVLVVAVVSCFSIIFQNVLFQRYRMNRNEAALRKERMHQQSEGRSRYRNSLLGEVKKDRDA